MDLYDAGLLLSPNYASKPESMPARLRSAAGRAESRRNSLRGPASAGGRAASQATQAGSPSDRSLELVDELQSLAAHVISQPGIDDALDLRTFDVARRLRLEIENRPGGAHN